jgi:phosphate uptake regulator
MKRRVIKQGNNTLTITLPREWCDRFGVKPGDELHLDESQHRLIVSPVAGGRHKEIEIELPKGSQFYRRFVITPYVQGYDNIKIVYHDPQLFPKIQNALNLLIGFEMTQQGERYCVFQNVAVPLEAEFSNMHNRLLHVAVDMLDTCADAFKMRVWDRLPGIAAMENQANRFNLYCRRMLNTMALEQHRVTGLYTINCGLEAITDFVRDICVALEGRNMKIDERIPAMLRKYADQVRLVKTLQDKKDAALWRKFIDNEKALDKELDALAPRLPSTNAILLLPLSGIKESLHTISEEF